MAFGGAGPLHAAEIADELEMRRVIVPTAGGVLSALGLVLSERRRDVVESVLLGGDELTQRGRRRGAATGCGARPAHELGDPDAELRATYDLRYAGQAFELPVEAPPDAGGGRTCAREFDRAHETRYGYRDDGRRARAGDRPRHRRRARRRSRGRAPRPPPSERGTRRVVIARRASSRRACSAPARRGWPGPRCSSSRARRWWCRPAGAPWPDADAVILERAS